MKSFDTEYKKLNPAQREAVESVEGPVMVVAGPGTGKTQVLAMRVSNILKKTHARPSNILCLTFSNAGVTAMRDRLRSLIGADAYGVTIATVHSFCDTLLRRHASLFSDELAKRPLSDIERISILESIADEMSSTSALISPRSPYDRISDILSRIADCKREGKTLEDAEKVADVFAEEMKTASKKGTKQHEKNLLAAEKFRDFVRIYGRYEEERVKLKAYDFDDMILTLLRALEDEEWLLQSLQERYQYILVDEAQDLNGAQWAVISRLITYENVPNDPNVFLVGDDDQSIYRFQGATTAHMVDFTERFPKAKIIVLTENYRSTQSILSAAESLIEKNEDRLTKIIPGLSKHLTSHAKQKGNLPKLLRTASDAAEPWIIADMIEKRIADGTQSSEIAILVQKNAELRPLYDVLRSRGIPCVLQGKAELLHHPVVREITTILRALESDASGSIARALGVSCLGVHPADLARLTRWSESLKMSFMDALLSIESGKPEGLTDASSLKKARDLLLEWRARVGSRTLLETTEHVIRESGVTTRGGKDIDPVDLAVIEAFFRYVLDRSLTEPFLSLQALLKTLDFYENAEYPNIRLSYELPHIVEAGVHLLTAHQSKGLEFECVILPSFRDGHWDKKRTPGGLSVPEELLFGWDSETKRSEKHSDERRLTYVAFTRAKRELIMLCPREFSVGERLRSVTPCSFFSEAGDLPEESIELQNPEKASVLLSRPKPIDDALSEYLHDRVKDFRLSPSSLTRFLRNPEEFRDVDLLRQPEMYTESSIRSLAYGSAVHWALRSWADSAVKGKKLTLSDFLESFAWYLKNRTILTKVQERDLLALSEKILPQYFESSLAASTPLLYAIERDFSASMASGPGSGEEIRLKGKIDRIDVLKRDTSDIEVIDYKTGKPKTLSVIRGGVEEGKVSWTAEGENFRQLVFYALLLELAEPLLIPRSFSLVYIGNETDQASMVSTPVLESEKEDLRALIRAVWKKIVALDFTPL